MSLIIGARVSYVDDPSDTGRIIRTKFSRRAPHWLPDTPALSAPVMWYLVEWDTPTGAEVWWRARYLVAAEVEVQK